MPAWETEQARRPGRDPGTGREMGPTAGKDRMNRCRGRGECFAVDDSGQMECAYSTAATQRET
jgi:hypothetical protein